MPENENIFHAREALPVMIACSDQGLNNYSFDNKKVFQLMLKQFQMTLEDEMYVFSTSIWMKDFNSRHLPMANENSGKGVLSFSHLE